MQLNLRLKRLPRLLLLLPTRKRWSKRLRLLEEEIFPQLFQDILRVSSGLLTCQLQSKREDYLNLMIKSKWENSSNIKFTKDTINILSLKRMRLQIKLIQALKQAQRLMMIRRRKIVLTALTQAHLLILIVIMIIRKKKERSQQKMLRRLRINQKCQQRSLKRRNL